STWWRRGRGIRRVRCECGEVQYGRGGGSLMNIDGAFIQAVVNALMQRGGRVEGAEIRFSCVFPERHEDSDAHPSARFHPGSAVWPCDACGRGGGILELARLLNLQRPEHESSQQKITGRWPIRDGTGHVVRVHLRLEPGRNGRKKDYIWQQPDRRPGLGGVR